MVSISCFERVFCESNVGLFLFVVFAGYCGLVNNGSLQTVSGERAGVLFSAVTCLVCFSCSTCYGIIGLRGR